MSVFTSKKFIIPTVIVAVLGAIAWSEWKGRSIPPEQRYTFVTVNKGTVKQTVSANGTLNPVTLVSVGTQVSGTVKRYAADFNDKVREGQVLLELDDATYRAQAESSQASVANAKSALDLASANAKRMRSLFDQGYVSRQDLDTATQAFRSAQAQLSAAAANHRRDLTNLGYTVIRSPVSGVVVAREVDVGQTVAASFQTPELYKIAKDLSKMQINTSFAEADIGGIASGMKATFTVDAYPGKHFVGTVSQVRLQATTTSNVVTYNVVVNVDNPDQKLLPGMTAYVNIVSKEARNVLLVPNSALRFKPANATLKKSGPKSAYAKEGQPGTVYLLGKDGEPQPVPVRVNITDGKVTELVEGNLKDGDRLITEDNSPKSASTDAGKSGMRLRMF